MQDFMIGLVFLIGAWIMGVVTHQYPFEKNTKVRVVPWVAEWSGGKDGYIEPSGCRVQVVGLMFIGAIVLDWLLPISIESWMRRWMDASDWFFIFPFITLAYILSALAVRVFRVNNKSGLESESGGSGE